MVDGERAETFGKETFASHPNVLLVDEEGIVRVRLDSYNEWHAHFLKLAVFALKTVPEKRLAITMSDIEKMMLDGEYPMALYYLEKQPEDMGIVCKKFKCYSLISPWYAKLYYDEVRKKWGDAMPDYTKFLDCVAQSVLESGCDYEYLLYLGYDASNSYINMQYVNTQIDASVWARHTVLKWNLCKSMVDMVRGSIQGLEKEGLDAPLKSYIEKIKKEMQQYIQ